MATMVNAYAYPHVVIEVPQPGTILSLLITNVHSMWEVNVRGVLDHLSLAMDSLGHPHARSFTKYPPAHGV